MYSQDGSFSDVLSDSNRNSDRRPRANQRPRQRLGDSLVAEPTYQKKSAQQRYGVGNSSRLSETTDPKGFYESDSSRLPGRSAGTEFNASRRAPMADSRRDEGMTSLRSNDTRNGYGNFIRNGYGNGISSAPMGNGMASTNNNNNRVNNLISTVGYGDPFRLNEDSDRSSENSQGSDDFFGNNKYQPWMDRIAGDTFRKGYFDRLTFRPTLQHDSKVPLSYTRQFSPQDPSNNDVTSRYPSDEKVKGKCTLRTILCVFGGVLIIGCIAGVLAYFLSMKGEKNPEIKYYVVSSELSLNQSFSSSLTDSTSEEFKNLSAKFCGAINEALQKNTTEYGNQYKHCDVIEFKNGSVIVVYKLYYVFTVVAITKEKVHQDLNNSLTPVNSDNSRLSDLIIIQASVTFTVQVESFETDPVTSTSTASTTTTTSTTIATTSALPEATTTAMITDNTATSTESAIETESTPEFSTTVSPESSSGSDTSLSSTTTSFVTQTDKTTDSSTESTTVTPIVSSTESITETQTVSLTESTTETQTVSSIESTTEIQTVSSSESTTVIPTVSSTESTTVIPTVSSTESTTVIPTVSSTESTTITPIVSSTERTTVTPIVSSTESTTEIQTVSSSESTTVIPTVSSTESTTDIPTVSSTESTTVIPTVSSTESTTVTSTVSSTESTTVTPIVSSTESTTKTQTVSSTDSTTVTPIASSTESTTKTQTVSSTESTTVTPIVSSTESTTETQTVSSTESTTETQTVSSTESTTEIQTVSSSESTTVIPTVSSTEIPTVSSTESTTVIPTVSSTESTTVTPIVSSTESTTKTQTVSSTDSTTVTPIARSTESTTVTPIVSSTESTTETQTVSSSESTTVIPNVSSTESTTEIQTVSSSESTTVIPTVSSTESTTEIPTVSSTESTTVIPTVSSTESTTVTPIASSTERTTETQTVSSTDSTTVTPIASSTESTTKTQTVSSTESTTVTPIVSSTESTTEIPTVSSTESTTVIPNVSSTESTTEIQSVSSSESTTVTSSVSSTESTTVTPSTTSAVISTLPTEMITSIYSADVMISSVTAIIGEVTTTQTCVISPYGDWVHATLTVNAGGTPHVLGKLNSNEQFERPATLERFNVSISKRDNDIVASLTLNLTAPTTDVCSWDGSHTISCSIRMNDTLQTEKNNGSQIFFTAPVSEVTIDSNKDFKEGDTMTFNCSSKVDPNHSFASVELIKDSKLLTTIYGPKPGTDYNSDCNVDFSWAADPPSPLTTNENDLIVRCVVRNSLLNITKTAEKVLNVSAADVAFTKYSYKTLTDKFEEIQCIARSSSQVLQDLVISRDDVPIASLNSSVTDSRYSVSSQSYDGDVRLILGIPKVECQDQGIYSCKMYKKDNTTLVSPNMSFTVEGSEPALSLHPDIYEPFARLGLNHVCSVEHVGNEGNDNYIELQISRPGNNNPFRYSNKTPDSEKMFDTNNNITYINITGTTSQFLLVSNRKSTSNSSCNVRETITFLLDLKMDFDNGTIKCVLKDERDEYSSVESRIVVLPGNFCEGYNDKAYRKHPNNDCNDYVNCQLINGKMYAIGNQCPVGQCFDFEKKYCVTCDSSFTCEELTTPGPTTTTTTLPPGIRYVSCNDSSHSVETTAVITCVVLDITFESLNISLLSAHVPRDEKHIGEIYPNGTVKSQAGSDVILAANFDSTPMIFTMTIETVQCSQEGQFRITSTGANSSFAPSVEAFEFDVLGNLTAFKLQANSAYQEGTVIEFNCTATLDESHAKIKGFYKKQSDSSFIEIEGSTTVMERNSSHCLADVLWKPTTLFTADASFNGAQFRCVINDWPSDRQEMQITVQNADVAFATYKIQSNIGSTVSLKCIARNINSLRFIRITKVDTSKNTSHTVGNVSFPNTTFTQSGMTFNYTTDSLTLTISKLDCTDEGYYMCVVGKQDNSEEQAPARLHLQPQYFPKQNLVDLALNPDIRENKYIIEKFHTCKGDIGYPHGLAYLSIKFINPITNASYTYDEKSMIEAMKTHAASPLKFKLSLAGGLSIAIFEDEEQNGVNCSGNNQIKFLIQATRDWNKAKLRCSVKNSSGEIPYTAVEEDLYVIPDSVCDVSNKTDFYVPHEKIDGCKTYIRCTHNVPAGLSCNGNLCWDHNKDFCDYCSSIACESEMNPTTQEPEISTTPPVTTPSIQCPLLSCSSDSVYEMETANLSCDINNTATYQNITVAKSGQSLMTIHSNGTITYLSNESNKYESSISPSFMFTIKNVSCSDRSDYTFTAEVDNLGTCSKTASLDLKAKPEKPELKIDYRWTNRTRQGTHVCTGNTGNPPGTLSLQVKNEGSGVFRNYTPSVITGSSTTFENCINKAQLSFSIDFTTEHLQGDYIRCVSNNRETLSSSESPFYSEEFLINPLPEDACYADGTFPYPGECRQYLNCFANVTNVQPCPSGLCYVASSNNCDRNCISCQT